ncbi:DNA double-strand break repair nuclease NurA [Halomarina ordinaria]|uniref:DNA double-strand break repair nuclease NurA n=1 Tax=Halomarina ordinaria TaxID=3033939 RepID=A0ABD5U2W7_9EURY|nr:DNA double-strand break repair nuclease NurA [Halomarina sp. PSRA2]
MTLDPVHFDGITRLAARLGQDVDTSDHRAFAETVWEEWLDPLSDDGDVIVEPLGERRRRMVDVTEAALQDDPFSTRHGLDSGTINPTTFKNGLVLDVAQAAMSAVPSDLDLHRGRTVVMTVHSNDATTTLGDEWTMADEGYTRQRVLHAPRVSRYEAAVVHELALYLAESSHALDNAGIVEDLLVMDGPIYPKGLLNWADREPELATLLVEDERPRDVIGNYLRLVETFVERDVPLVGFVKTPISRSITRTVREGAGNAPWVNDAAFFSKVLERREEVDGEWERLTDALTFTNWFVSRGGADRELSTLGDAFGLERRLDPADYEVTFCVVYDPRTDVVYRVEAPAVFTRDAEHRERLLLQVLKGVAVERGPPKAVGKADSLAGIGRAETTALRAALERAFETELDTGYDEERWGPFGRGSANAD